MTIYTAESEQALISELNDPQISDNLYNYVMFSYPWGKENTPLVNQKGPRNWQRDELDEITDHIASNIARIELGLTPIMWKKATASGRGPGKSALISWLSDWNASCHLGSTTIVSANSETQLKTKTFAEIRKWSSLMLNAHWFDIGILDIRPKAWFSKLLLDQLGIDSGYYYVQAQLWAEENPDAFAGAHNEKGVMVNYDEGSGIPIPIWDVTEGFFTEPNLHRYWNVYSNPRKNKGAFYDCFDKNSAFWRKRHIDSRTVEGLDHARFDAQIAQHGLDSDFSRVEILGQFPKQGDKQFMSSQLVRDAQKREVIEDPNAALVLGCDIARFGIAATVLRFRQGRDARRLPPIVINQRDTIFVAMAIAAAIDKYHPDAVNIDAGNTGGAVIDWLKDKKYRVNEIWFGSTKNIPAQWADKRTAMYADVRDWLLTGAIDDRPELYNDLTTPDAEYSGKTQDTVKLESKESMIDKGYASPDHGDALALTFAVPVSRRDTRTSRHGRSQMARDINYPIFG